MGAGGPTLIVSEIHHAHEVVSPLYRETEDRRYPGEQTNNSNKMTISLPGILKLQPTYLMVGGSPQARPNRAVRGLSRSEMGI